MSLRYKIEWVKDKGQAESYGELCIVNTESGDRFAYYDSDSVDWLFQKIDRLNELARMEKYPPLKLVWSRNV